jgi:membrane-associated phospholipid phosphatase
MTKKITFCFLFLFITTICFAQNWDIDLLKEINLHRERSLDHLFKIITDYAAPLAYCIPFFLFGYSMIKRNKPLKASSIYIIQSAALALVISTALKHIVNRARPFITYPFIQKLTTGGSASFPSGHTSDAFTLAASLSFSFPKWYVIVPSFAWAIAVGYSRMDLGVHYPSDVFASVIIGISSAFICYKLKSRKEKNRIELSKVKDD